MKLFVPASPVRSIVFLVLDLPFLLFGLFMLLATAILFVQEWVFLRNAEHTTGTIEHFNSEVRTSGNSRTTYYKSVYTFLDRTGRKYTGTSDEESRDKPADEVGRSVPLLYDPSNLEKSQFDTFSSSWGTTLWCGIVGVGLTAPGLWLLTGCIRGLRRKTQTPATSPPGNDAAPAPERPPVASTSVSARELPMPTQLRYPRVNLLFNLLLIVMIVGAVWAGTREKLYLTHAHHTLGKVVSVKSYLQQVKGSSGYMKYRPTLSFNDETGKPWTFDSGSYGLEGRSVGAVLPVVYEPEHPGNAQIESFWGEWDPTFTFAYVAVFAVILRWIFRQAVIAAPAPTHDPAILSGP